LISSGCRAVREKAEEIELTARQNCPAALDGGVVDAVEPPALCSTSSRPKWPTAVLIARDAAGSVTSVGIAIAPLPRCALSSSPRRRSRRSPPGALAREQNSGARPIQYPRR
jgi:hypothetical protein